MEQYFLFEKNEINKNKNNLSFITGKYYRFYNEKYIQEEYVELNVKNDLKWINEKYKLNILSKFQLLNNSIISSASGMNFQFKIIDDKTLKYVNGDTKYIYKLK